MERAHRDEPLQGGLATRSMMAMPHAATPLAAARSAEREMLRLQQTAGNRATSYVVARLRAEDEVIEPEPGRTAAGGIGPAPTPEEEPVQRQAAIQRQAAVQRHRIPSNVIGPPPIPEDDAGPVQTHRDAIQRQGVGAAAGALAGFATGAAAAAAGAFAGRAAAGAAVNYPDYSTVSGNTTISGETSTAWTETKAATSDGSRREQGFWVRWNKDTGGMSATGKVTAPTVGNATAASVSLGARPADSGSNYTVGSFHTHTPTRYRSVGRPVGPSSGDTSADTSDNVTGLVYDYTSPDDSGNIPAHHPLNSAARLWHSGPNRRT